jgi:thioredoxin 1
MTSEYKTEQPERTEIDALTGPAVVEFGTNWCGICKAAQPNIAEAFAKYPNVRRIKVEDGSGRPLGARSTCGCGPRWCSCATARK